MKPPITVDDYELWNSDQAWRFEQHWSIDGELLRVSIKRDAYDKQSYARVDIWSPSGRGWNHLCQLFITQLDCSAISYVTKRSSDVCGAFERSCKALIDRAAKILSAVPSYPDRA